MTNVTPSEGSSVLSCAQLSRLLSGPDSGSWLLIDLRPVRRFRRGHLPGSHSIPAARLLSGEPPEGELILISESPEQAQAVSEALHAGGYNRRILTLAEGLQAWCALGLPLEADEVAEQRPAGALVLPALAGTALILVAASLTSLPLLALGTLLLWETWFRPMEGARILGQRLRAGG